LTPTNWRTPPGLTSVMASATSSGLPTASATTSAPRSRVSIITRSRSFSFVGSTTTPAPRRLAKPRRSSSGSDRISRLAPRRLASAIVSRPMIPPPITSTVASRGIGNDSSAAKQPPAHAAADRPHDAGVLVAEHERRLVGKEALRGMDIGAADAGRLDGDDDLARACDGLGDLVEREAGAAVPGGDLHGCYLSSSVTKMQWRRRPSSALERWPLPEVSSTRMTSPAPILRDSPSLAVICTPASRLMMYWRRGAGCQSRS